jgi:hypothetical protein
VPLIIILPITLIGIIPAIIMIVYIFMDIAAARGKSKWLAALICVPFINSVGQFFYWGYLAFTSGGETFQDDSESLPKIPVSDKAEEEAGQDADSRDKAQQPPFDSQQGLDGDPPLYNG